MIGPTPREGCDLGRMAQPNARFSSGGGALIGEEGDKAASVKGSMCGFETIHIIMDGDLVEVPNEMEEVLPRGVMCGTRHSDRVFAKNMEDPGHPFPVAVVHGKEEGGGSFLNPWATQFLEWGQVQTIPASGEKKYGLLHGALEQQTREFFQEAWVHQPSQLKDFFPARYGHDPSERSCQGASYPLGRRWTKGKDHAAVLERCR